MGLMEYGENVYQVSYRIENNRNIIDISMDGTNGVLGDCVPMSHKI